ncbi:sodium- and chloride-dependent gaba transporter ine-like [Plakobranchus ocellatus]|uniref:Sodium- and chloride-dependent gaba transporter ine-like n=1 Tax=Plakobranchus ocellatus TaxID=259542 RepID=A0AAV4AP18_9GAST|nr:sodium- and chloride-dependent gaba transporter ine-like [Plakobranchus ocellatus]
MLVLCGVPLAFMEMAVGQYTRQGPIGALSKLCPFFKGAGLATVVISFLFTTYYVVIITWSFYYMFHTFTSELPWTHCNHSWNSELCWDQKSAAKMAAVNNVTFVTTNLSASYYDVTYNRTSASENGSAQSTTGNVVLQPNGSRSPTEDFFIENVLQKSSGIEEQGSVRWELLLILLMCWVIVYFCIWKGPKSTGKVVYFTATFPYLVLVILLGRGITLPGSDDGIEFFIKPRWELLLDAKVWVNAAAQNFNSLGVAFGGLITMSSYSKYNNNIVRDVLILAVVDAVTCLLAGFAIFAILGNLALSQGKAVGDVVEEGPGLVFVIYPQAFNTMPVAQLFAFLFFFMLICLGIDSQFASVEVIVTTIQDHYGHHVRHYLRRKEVLVFVVCLVSFLAGLPNITQGGFYFFQLIDYYAAALSLMILAFFEVIAICWFYGAKNLADNITHMTGIRPNAFFIVCWYFVSPLLILGIWIFSLVQYKPLSIAGYTYPDWAVALGWIIALVSVACIPIGMFHGVMMSPGTSWGKKLVNSFNPILMPEHGQPIFTDKSPPIHSNGLGGSDIGLTQVVTPGFAEQPDQRGREERDCLQL